MASASKLLWLLLFLMPGGFVLAPVMYFAARVWMRHVQPAFRHVRYLRRLPANTTQEAPTDVLVGERSSRAPAC